VFFRKSMILIRLLEFFLQEFDFKRVAMCAREVAEPAIRGEADLRGMMGLRAAPAKR
jgi:hypothetical protein